ncbi:MAG: FtsW/RodA/SpoVE family cell cycle protein [Eubacteriaceae bacterium]|nr:FtsW/RodA/SpoVE family cell cycle protein [Eubacteriaceae bacterium]
MEIVSKLASGMGRPQLICISIIALSLGVHASMLGAFAQYLTVLPAIIIIVLVVSYLSPKTDSKGKLIIFIPAFLGVVGLTVQAIIAHFNNDRIRPATVIAAIVLACAMAAPYKLYRKWLNYIYIVWFLHIMTLMPYVFTLIYTYRNNQTLISDNWVRIAGISFQPSEIAKFLYVFSMSTIMNNPQYSERKKMGIAISISGACALLLCMQGEFGSIFIMLTVFLMVTFTYADIEPLRLIKNIISLALVCLALVSIVYVYTRVADNAIAYFLKRQFDKIATRVYIWRHFDEDIEDSGYQLWHGLRAMKTGGNWGTDGTRFVKVPVSESDMIFPMIVQSYGMFFGIFIIVAYLIYAIVTLMVAVDSRDYLNRGVVFGFTATLFLQACFQIAGSTAVFLLSGNTLPFVSHGSTSLLICTLMAAVIFQIHQFNLSRASDAAAEPSAPQE